MLPSFLTEFKEELEKYHLETAHIEASPVAEGEQLSLMQSKFLGKPFLPLGFDYPKSKNGLPMVLWAQINFEEVPRIAGYPKQGILQLFVAAHDWYDGDDYAIIFHENTSQEIQTDFSFLPDRLYEECPIHCEHRLHFSKIVDNGSSEDSRFEPNFNGESYFDFQDRLSEEQQNEMNGYFDGSGHKIGGYAYFTQSDPRGYEKEKRNDVLILQIDSGDDIMIGDMGVANVFISEEDLRNKNFTKAWFNWDCC